MIQIGTFEVTSQYFAYFISISSLVFENDKWTFGGCFGHFNMYHDLKVDCETSYSNLYLSLSTARSGCEPFLFLTRFERREKPDLCLYNNWHYAQATNHALGQVAKLNKVILCIQGHAVMFVQVYANPFIGKRIINI